MYNVFLDVLDEVYFILFVHCVIYQLNYKRVFVSCFMKHHLDKKIKKSHSDFMKDDDDMDRWVPTQSS